MMAEYFRKMPVKTPASLSINHEAIGLYATLACVSFVLALLGRGNAVLDTVTRPRRNGNDRHQAESSASPEALRPGEATPTGR